VKGIDFFFTEERIELNITVIGGGGYVGFTTAVCLASKGHTVYCVDQDLLKVEQIRMGLPVIYESGLSELFRAAFREGRLFAASDPVEAVLNSSIVFICAGTPCGEEGKIDLRQIIDASTSVGEALARKHGYITIVVKSTVVPKTTESVVIPLLEEHSGRKAGVDFGVCMNPEFLREGQAVEDFLSPRKQGIVVGELDEKSGDFLAGLYSDFDGRLLRTSLSAAEMIKYARNAYLAKDISFANEIANICQELDIDYLDVKQGLELDSRIGEGRFLNAGIGFGGSCFSKDVKALAYKAKEVGVSPSMLQATLLVNEDQPGKVVLLAEKALGTLEGKNMAVLGLAFKPGTDDMRDARAVPIIQNLLLKGAKVSAFDPQAMEQARRIFGDKLCYANSAVEALRHADACMIVTEWPEFSDPGLYESLAGNFLIDGRRALNPQKLSNRLVYLAIGFPEVENS
jgi:UDPglucose 6-dehydrogenase